MNFGPVYDAKLGPADLAKLLKISRVTASLWLNGHSRPHQLLHDRVVDLLDAVDKATQAGDLPVPHRISRRERGLYITNTIAKHQGAGVRDEAGVTE